MVNLKVADAARLMHKSEHFIRLCLQDGSLPFGTAKMGPGGKYSYYISPELFEKYTGIKLPREYFEDTKKENT